MTTIQKIKHLFGFCPRQKAGHYCTGKPGRCGWQFNKKGE